MDIDRLGASAGLHPDERELILGYIAMLETGTTRDHCLCQWSEVFKGKFRRGDAHEDCPIHTKEGFLLGFLKFTTMLYNESNMCVHGVTFDGTHVCGPCVGAWAVCIYRKHHVQPLALCTGCGWRPELAAQAKQAVNIPYVGKN
jgi:hypothetical protein